MKKQLLTIVALLFAAITAMAQVELGAPQWNIKDGAKVSLNKVISLAFPNATGVTAESTISIAGNLYPADEEQGSEPDFDGLEASIANPVDIVLTDILDEVQEKTTYNLVITSVLVDGVEQLGDGETLSISFTTRGGERQMSWTFTIDEESVNKIKADDKNVSGGVGEYWSVVAVDARHYYHKKTSYDEMMLDATTPLPMTEGLLFSAGADKIYVGDVVTTTYKNCIVFNANDLSLQIPDLKAGDIVTFRARRATAYSGRDTSKPKLTYLANTDGTATAVNGLESSRGLVDSLQLAANNNYADYKFTITSDGDITFIVSQAYLSSITIEEGKPIVDVNYSVVAVAEDDETKVLKTYKETTVGKTYDPVNVNYSYWLTDSEGNLYTYGSKGNPFTEPFILSDNDTVFVIKYKKTEITDVVYLSEGEDFFDEEAQERTIEMVTQSNSAIRSSNCKAAYATADTKITTLPAGTYTFKAIIFDNTGKSSGFIQSIGISENTDEDLLLAANADNWTEAQETFVLENESDIIWRTGGNANKGIDIMVIYKADGGDAVASVEAAETAAPATRKVVKDGKFLIETANGTFTAAGAQVK